MTNLKFLLDENIGKPAISLLRDQKLDIKSVLEDNPGADDLSILDWAVKEQRILVTLDKDFGKLVFYNSHQHIGIVFLRLQFETPENIFKTLLNTINLYGSKLQGKFTIATEYSIRIR